MKIEQRCATEIVRDVYQLIERTCIARGGKATEPLPEELAHRVGMTAEQHGLTPDQIGRVIKLLPWALRKFQWRAARKMTAAVWTGRQVVQL